MIRMTTTPLSAPRSWDIFCSVVDNFGDIGICWRLARQLVAEHGQRVRLWVDDLASFRRLEAALDPARDRQWLQGVEVRHWATPFAAITAADIPEVVVEALACTLPESYQQAMAARPVKPRWINLEHLSAEGWIVGCHRGASPQPRLPLTKYFFFPGFVADSGGLLRERGLLAAAAAFRQDEAAQSAFCNSLGVPPRQAGEVRLSLFAYGSRDLAGLLAAWRDGPQPLRCLVPAGRLAEEIGSLLGTAAAGAGQTMSAGNLHVHRFSFLAQPAYDRLLWACDINFVRGEDSFVRAQWAGLPMVWQPYRQPEQAHDEKLDAFLRLYLAGLPAAAAEAVAGLHHAWNHEAGVAAAWSPYLAELPAITAHARQWAKALAQQPDLATNLVLFAQNPL